MRAREEKHKGTRAVKDCVSSVFKAWFRYTRSVLNRPFLARFIRSWMMEGQIPSSQ